VYLYLVQRQSEWGLRKTTYTRDAFVLLNNANEVRDEKKNKTKEKEAQWNE